MQTRTHFALALTLTALGLAPGAAHLMELPVKLGYPAAFYAEVTSTLYAWYGVAGGSVRAQCVSVSRRQSAPAVRNRRGATRKMRTKRRMRRAAEGSATCMRGSAKGDRHA